MPTERVEATYDRIEPRFARALRYLADEHSIEEAAQLAGLPTSTLTDFLQKRLKRWVGLKTVGEVRRWWREHALAWTLSAMRVSGADPEAVARALVRDARRAPPTGPA